MKIDKVMSWAVTIGFWVCVVILWTPVLVVAAVFVLPTVVFVWILQTFYNRYW